MSNLPFPPELRTASIVPRWSIVWTLNKDYVSNHSFFVTMYAVSIARLIHWKGPYDFLMYEALIHDLDETITGDIVSPVKKEILDPVKAAAYVQTKMKSRLPYMLDTTRQLSSINSFPDGSEGFSPDVQLILKAADRLDALLFLIVEQRLGNTVIGPRIPDALRQLKDAWWRLPGLSQRVMSTWEKEVLPSIEAHKAEGGSGV